MDRHTPKQRKRNMQAVKSAGSKIEKTLGKALWKKGFRYRKNVKTIFGKPDFVLRKYNIVIFCDSEFWHGKDWETKKIEIKSNQDFWYKKIERNIERDNEVNLHLKNEDWTVIRFWGKEILNNTEYCVKKVESEIKKKHNK